MIGASITLLVDALMRAKKTLAGEPDWKEVGHRGEHRLVLPLMIEGTVCPLDLEINGYPISRSWPSRTIAALPIGTM
jgi:hypothetical protein